MVLNDITNGTALTPVHDDRATEGRRASSKGLQDMRNVDILTAFLKVQRNAIDEAVYKAIPDIAEAANAMIDRLKSKGRNNPKGRIIYTGAGTSGRLGYVDGVELGPTFDWPDDKVVFAQAEPGEFKTGSSRDGLEDRRDLAEQKVEELNVGPDDVVIALAVSGTTPYTTTFTERARERGALVIGIANNRTIKGETPPLLKAADYPIVVETGAEVIAGSSRMGAGTAHKAVLTMLSSLVMSKLPGIHGVHDGLMVNMRKPPNAKLYTRAHGMVSQITGCDQPTAEDALKQTEGDIKAATLVTLGATPKEADTILTDTDNHLGNAMDRYKKSIKPEAIRETQQLPTAKAR